MPNLKYSANGQKTAQSYSRTLGAPSVGSTYIVTCNGKTFTYTAVSTTAADEAALLVASFNAQTTIPELQEVTASIVSGAVIKFEANTPGTPIDLSFSTGGTGSPTFASSTSVANSSPSDVSNTANWSSGSLPAASDSVYLAGQSTNLSWGLGAVTNALTLLDIAKTYTGQIGLPEFVNINSYPEYRTPRYWQVKTTTLNIGTGEGNSRGSNLIMLDLSTTAVTINVFCTGQGLNGQPAVQLLAVNAANKLFATNGSVGIALNGTEVSTFSTVNLTDENGPVTFHAGPGLTLATLNMLGSRTTAVLGVSPTNLTMQAIGRGKSGGACIIKAGNLTTCVIDAGTLIYRGTGSAITIGSVSNPLVLGEKAILDLSEGDGSVTCSNGLTMRAGAKIIDPRNRLTGTTITFSGCSPDEVTIIRGQGSTLVTA